MNGASCRFRALPSRFVAAEVAVAGVHSGGQAVSGGQLGQELAQLGTFGPGERRADGLLVVEGGLAQGGHGLLPRGGEVQRVVAPVAGIAAPFDQATLFQAVHQRDQPARRGAEPAGDRLLAQPRLPADQAEQPGLRAGEVERGGPLAEPLGGVAAELREQERDVRPLALFLLVGRPRRAGLCRRTLGVTAPGAVIGLAGGILAAASLALSGLVTWVVADTAHIAGPALAKALFDLSFAAGAAGFVVPFALLIAGVAVPSLILRLTPRPLAWGGLVVAAIGMLSTLTLVAPALDFALPIGRFGGLIFIVAVSALLPATRHRLTAAIPVAA